MSFYLTKRNQTYYYRIKIPSDLTHLIPTREIKQSLRTCNLAAAKLVSAGINAKVQSLFGLLRVGVIDAEEIPALIASYLPRKQRYKVVATDGCEATKVKLSGAIQLFVSDKGPRWTVKTRLEFTAMFDVLLALVGDRELCGLTRADGLACRDKLKCLPTNFRKKKQYRDLSIDQILTLEVDDTLSVKTLNKYLVLVSSLFKWCVKNGMMDTNIAEGLSLPVITAAHEERKAYSLDDIKRMVLNLPRNSEGPEKYWIPMIAMYSGLRLDECCQLHMADIRLVDGILCFDVNDVGDRKVKTQGSKRLVPVHPKLLEIGFDGYLKGRASAGALRLWENLEPNKYGYWGKGFGKWYGKFNRKYVTEDPLKVFHSFRHLVADTLKQACVAEGVIAEILGHANQSITTGRYGKRYRPAILLEALKKLDY